MRINFYKLRSEDYVKEARKYWLDRKTYYEFFKKGFAPLNFDADDKSQALKIARKLRKMFGKKKGYAILMRKSSSRRGWHFTVFKDGKQLFLPIKKVLKLRKKIGDCYGRLRCDIVRAKHGLPISILFDHKAKVGKKIKFATSWKELKIKDIK